mgnify:CR=1 FL=1
MIPLHDDNPTAIKPVVTLAVIVACVVIFLYQTSLAPYDAGVLVYGLGMIPSVVLGPRELAANLYMIPSEISVITSMFLHGGWMHLIGNMAFLWVFGNNIEDAMGHVKFIAFYLLCGIAAAMTQAVQDLNSDIPMIGASGAIGGILGAYLLLYPKARVLVFFGFFVGRIPAVVMLGIWFVFQFIQDATAGGSNNVAHWAHIGGFVAGMVLIIPFKHRHVKLFGDGKIGPRMAGGARTGAPHRSRFPSSGADHSSPSWPNSRPTHQKSDYLHVVENDSPGRNQRTSFRPTATGGIPRGKATHTRIPDSGDAPKKRDDQANRPRRGPWG